MATRGYNSYRGRTSAGKIVLIVVLVLVLLGAVGYLVVQNYLVYDEAGQVHLELPFGNRGKEEQTGKPPVENVDIDQLDAGDGAPRRPPARRLSVVGRGLHHEHAGTRGYGAGGEA